MPNRDVSEPYINSRQAEIAPVGNSRPADASNFGEGYDEAQRAEIAEVEGSGPREGDMLSDMDPDISEDLDEDEIEDDADGLTQIVDTSGSIADDEGDD